MPAPASKQKAANDTASAASPAYREAPYNLEAEQAALGAILVNNESLNRIGDFLRPEHFYEPVHRRIFEAIERFTDRGLIATPVTLKSLFDSDAGLTELGGAAYLAKLAGLGGSILDIRSHASIVYSLAISRSLITIGTDMVTEAYESGGEKRASEQIERAEHRLFTLASEGSSDTNFHGLRGSVQRAIESADAARHRKVSGISTGFHGLDNILGGLQNSDLIILAARPSMGKTALALNLAFNAAKVLQKEHSEQLAQNADNADFPKEAPAVGFVSLEMSSEQLSTRMLAMVTALDASNIRRGKLAREDFSRLLQGQAQLHTLPVFIDDTPAQTIAAVRTRARRLKRKHNLSLLVVDYLQLLRGVSDQSQQNRVQEISEITMGLKAIAKELNIPVLALSQLSRQVENRENKRPQLSDLRESGSIEQDADIVMFIYREAYYLERTMPATPDQNSASYDIDMKIWEEWVVKNGERYEAVKNKTDIIIAKHRNGPVGNVQFVFNGATTQFMDAVPDYQQNSPHNAIEHTPTNTFNAFGVLKKDYEPSPIEL